MITIYVVRRVMSGKPDNLTFFISHFDATIEALAALRSKFWDNVTVEILTGEPSVVGLCDLSV